MDIMLIVIKPSSHHERLYKDNKYNLFLVNINLALTPRETILLPIPTYFLFRSI